MKKYRLIIPSWAPQSVDMQAETGSLYPAFIQLGGLPLYAHIIKLYESIKEDIEIVVVLSQAAPALKPDLVEGFDVQTVRLVASQSIGQTVLFAMNGLSSEQVVIVHMADTLVSSPELCKQSDVVYVQPRTDLYRWTSVRQSSNGKIHVITDRDHLSAGNSNHVCVGVFMFSDGMCFSEGLKLAVSKPVSCVDPFFHALENYSAYRSVELKCPNAWHDCGHIDSYYESRLNYQNLRHFNTLNYDANRGIVTKLSVNTEAFRHQVRWFKQVPDEIVPFVPRIYESNDGSNPCISMELLTLPTLSDLFVNKRLDVGAWNDVAQKVRMIQTIFQKYSYEASVAKQIAAEIYVEKTKRRMSTFCEQNPEARHFWIRSSGTTFTLNEVMSTIDYFAKSNGLLTLEKLTPIHGDMCFSNLMYDPRSRHLKLIDPRGEFGVPGIYGDARYDKAKLMHSYSGGYDFIVTDSFNLAISAQGELDCIIERCDYHNLVSGIFERVIFKNNEERNQCEAIQALLFLSMLPLHSDNFKRQLAMLYVGLNLYARKFPLRSLNR